VNRRRALPFGPVLTSSDVEFFNFKDFNNAARSGFAEEKPMKGILQRLRERAKSRSASVK
jgi:hypothetical protein